MPSCSQPHYAPRHCRVPWAATECWSPARRVGGRWEVYSFDHEDGVGQFEVDYNFAPALTGTSSTSSASASSHPPSPPAPPPPMGCDQTQLALPDAPPLPALSKCSNHPARLVTQPRTAWCSCGGCRQRWPNATEVTPLPPQPLPQISTSSTAHPAGCPPQASHRGCRSLSAITPALACTTTCRCPLPTAPARTSSSFSRSGPPCPQSGPIAPLPPSVVHSDPLQSVNTRSSAFLSPSHTKCDCAHDCVPLLRPTTVTHDCAPLTVRIARLTSPL